MGVYENIKKTLQDIVVPELQTLRDKKVGWENGEFF